jgi:hypothetical protein
VVDVRRDDSERALRLLHGVFCDELDDSVDLGFDHPAGSRRSMVVHDTARIARC